MGLSPQKDNRISLLTPIYINMNDIDIKLSKIWEYEAILMEWLSEKEPSQEEIKHLAELEVNS